MTKRTHLDITRREGKTFRLAHCLLPAWRGGEIESASEPGSIAIAFTGQADAVVREADGAARPRFVPPMTIGLGGDVPIVWLETSSPSDVLEITGAAELRREMARDMRVESHANLDDVHGWQDPIIQATATRLRAALRGWMPMSDLEAETLVRAAYAQALRRHFGGREGIPRTLDARRRQRVVELVLDIGDGPLTLGDLAEAAALSPFHFARSFTKTFGMPPHRFVTVSRLERALHALRSTQANVPQAAAAAGFSNLHHFRQLFRRQYGVLPSDISRQAWTRDGRSSTHSLAGDCFART
jgi:AraC-like DNA-binding protein